MFEIHANYCIIFVTPFTNSTTIKGTPQTEIRFGSNFLSVFIVTSHEPGIESNSADPLSLVLNSVSKLSSESHRNVLKTFLEYVFKKTIFYL